MRDFRWRRKRRLIRVVTFVQVRYVQQPVAVAVRFPLQTGEVCIRQAKRVGRLENSLTKQVGQWVIDVREVAHIVNRTDQAGNQANLPVGAAQPLESQ